MADPRIVEGPKSLTVMVGEKAKFQVKAEDATTYEWRRSDTKDAIPDATSDTYELKAAQATDSGVKFTVVAKSADKSSPASDPAELTVVAEVPLLHDPAFAGRAAVAVVGLAGAALLPLWILAKNLLAPVEGQAPNFPAIVATQLVIVGVLIAAGAIYLALLDFRGRARTLKELQGTPPTDVVREVVLPDVVKSVPEILKAFGDLKAPAGLMVLAATLFISAAAIGWKAVPAGTPSPTPTASPTSSPPATGD